MIKYRHSALGFDHVTGFYQVQETVSKRVALRFVSASFFFLLHKSGAAVVLVYRAAVVSGFAQTAPSLGELRVFNGVTFITSPLLSH